MAELNLDFSRSSANGLLPEGWYYAFIYHIEPKRSDRARWIECQFKLMQEPAMDRLLTVRIFTDNSTGLKRLRKLNEALGIEIDYREPSHRPARERARQKHGNARRPATDAATAH